MRAGSGSDRMPSRCGQGAPGLGLGLGLGLDRMPSRCGQGVVKLVVPRVLPRGRRGVDQALVM